jgi:hypothetical protein
MLGLFSSMGGYVVHYMWMVYVGALTDTADIDSRLLAVDRYPGSWDYRV